MKLEDDNLDPKSGKQRQLWCYAISAKRYALYVRDAAGEPTLLHKGVNNKVDGWSEHGLGHLLNPADPNIEDRDWIRQAWEIFIREGHDLPAIRPAWLNRPAVGRTSVSSPFLHKAFGKLNDGKPYAETVKPFNFLLTAHVEAFGHPPGVDPKRFHLVAPYRSDPRQWRKMRWLDIYSRNAYGISTSGRSGSEGVARVKTYASVFKDYRHHPEAKSLAPSGRPCERSDIGLLKRRPVIATWVALIGKESNELELVQAGLIHSAEQVYSEYEQPGRNYWIEVTLPILRRMPLKVLIELSGMSPSALKAIRKRVNPVIPHPSNQLTLAQIVLRWSNEKVLK